MRLLLNKNLLVVLIVMIAAVPAVQAGGQAIDYEKMDRDLRIMEKVINMVLSEDHVKGFFNPQKVKGAYLEGYGVVFMIPVNFTSTLEGVLHSGGTETSIEESYNAIREKLTDFVSSYADAIKQVDSDEWITLVVNPSVSSNVLFFEFQAARSNTLWTRSEEKAVQTFKQFPFIMGVRKTNITQYRENKIDYDRFSETVSYSPLGTESAEYVSSAMLADIKILRGILETVIEDHFNTTISAESIQGTYLKEYGVLFTVNASLSSSVKAFDSYIEPKVTARGVEVADVIGRIEGYRSTVLAARQDSARIEELTNLFTEVIGDFGHTIREMEQDDEIAILYSSTSPTNRGNTNLMLTVRYKDIIDYSQGKISLDQFRRRVVSRTFE